jgi:hypothetical protein
MSLKTLINSLAMNSKEREAEYKLCAELHRQLAKTLESDDPYKSAAISRELANSQDKISRTHGDDVVQLGSAATAAPDHWNLAGWTLDSDGQPTNDKARKSAVVVDDFLSKYRLTRQTPPTHNYRDILS